MTKHYWYLILFGCFAFSCKQGKKEIRFSVVPPAQSAITFENTIQETEQLNVMKYEYMYNGGGVAIGDLNGDSLPDIYLTGNMVPDKLYLNQGKLSFKDITEAAGIQNHPGWKTGVTMADVNADGLLDIYVCYSGNTPLEERGNQLFINQGVQQGVPVFKEMAAAYGLDGKGSNSTQAAFFDYDRDGDLDMFLLNHATMFYNPFYNTEKLRTLRHPYFGNKLYRNDSLHFTDVSEAAGIKGGGINFGLGIGISDVNNDGWPDIYVTNDYEEQDFLYLNNHDGTFNSEAIKESIAHISRNGMGVDIADYNNDGLQDIIVLDMLPEDNYRQKMLRGPDDYDKYHLLVDNGYYHQNMRNTLQLNNGITPSGIPVYSEIGQLAGVSNTDWSWAPLMADYDNDGLKDLFITNGILHDFTDMDFMKYKVADARRQQGSNMQTAELVKQMPSLKTSNYMYRNKGDLTFADVTKEWGLHVPSVNSGAAYADLDNDGDVDLVVNATNEPSLIWENHTSASKDQHYITIALKGRQPNTYAIGAKVSMKTGTSMQCQELYPARGFQSTVDPRLHFGLGKDTIVDQLTVQWADGHTASFHHIKPDRIFTIDETQPGPDSAKVPALTFTPYFKDITQASGLNFTQQENQVVDFKYQPLLPYQLSCQGPQLSKGDVNGDGLEDVFIGGPRGEASALFLQTAAGAFIKSPSQPWVQDSLCETIGSCLFDADKDGDLDLYAVSGGNEIYTNPLQLEDRLYLNDGKGSFEKAAGVLPKFTDSRSCVIAGDFDKDGDADLFIGGRLQPQSFPLASRSYILRNDTKNGQLKFTDVTEQVAPELRNPGMVTNAVWTDVNKDSWPDLMIVGEWMPVKLFLNKQGRFSDVSQAAGLSATGGLWQKIVADDIDGDGDTDFILGNLAPNTQFKASVQEPMCMYINDFNMDGVTDPIICYYIQGKSYPYPSRDELLDQIVMLRKKYVHYSDYANTTIEDIFPPEVLKKSKMLQVQQLRNVVLINEGKEHFSIRELPVQAQFSAVFGILSGDFDNDGKKDLVLGGNFYPFRVQLGREDASKGLFLKGDGKGAFTPLDYQASGLLIDGDVRDLVMVSNPGKQKLIIAAKSNGAAQVLSLLNH
ncbi:MAG TPA: VCBS repeat-containing protein [Chitinophaga sp.]